MSVTIGPNIPQTINASAITYKPKAKVSIKSCEMSKSMCEQAIRIADDAFSSHFSEVDLAERLKKSFDTICEGLWHCAVGRHFESALTHRHGSFLHFHIGCLSVHAASQYLLALCMSQILVVAYAFYLCPR